MPSYVRPGIRKCAKNRALSESEVEFLIQLVEQGLRGLPIVLVRGHGGRTRLVEVACHYNLLFSLRIDGLVSSWADSNFSAASL